MFKHLLRRHFQNQYTSLCKYSSKRIVVLGIETSCDDTGVAVVQNNGTILGQSLLSQQSIHLKFGGIIPPIAQDHHRKNIEKAVQDCLSDADIDFDDVDAIAVTNRPGLPLSLIVGVRYAKHLCRKYSKPLVPVHHMEAHAMSARLSSTIPFPFLCLLISGGHCQLVLVKTVNEFHLLGESIDDAPGEAFDKLARRLRLRYIPKYEHLNGGAAMELAAKEAKNIDRFDFPLPLARYRDCQFSFAGLKNNVLRHIKKEELTHNVCPDEIIPFYNDFCAGFLKAITRHISNRTQRAIEYCNRINAFPHQNVPKSLVISGGVACNDFIFNSITKMAKHYDFKTFRPLKELCCDNGAMIAWNALEKMKYDKNWRIEDIDSIDIIGKCKLGISKIDDVTNANISCKWIKVE